MIEYYSKGKIALDRERGWSGRGINIDKSLYLNNTLPIVFIPSFTKKKLEVGGYDYKKVFKELGVREDNVATFNTPETFSDAIKKFNKILGVEESILLDVLNRRMVSGVSGNIYGFPIQKYTAFDVYNELYQDVLTNKLFPLLSNESDTSKPYSIEVTNDYIYIIMNTNSFYSFEDTYKMLSRELCELLLCIIDDSFVFQSSFFKSL